MPAQTRCVQLVVFDGFQLLDLAGPADVFHAATVLSGEPLYDVEVVAARPGAVRTPSGVEIVATRAVADDSVPVDTLLVTGGLTLGHARRDTMLIDGIRQAASRADRIGSICAGAFLLAEAGLLNGRTVTTHWAGSTVLIDRYPEIQVEPDRIYVRDGNVWTSAGVSAGIDLAIALVAADHGPDLAREISRWLVVYLHRPGGQSQFSAPVAAGPPNRPVLHGLQPWIEENLAGDLSLEALARYTSMSTRNFSRVFAAEFGTTPARYVETARVTAARRLLETTDFPLERVAGTVGLHRPETLYRSFQRVLGVAPGAYRERFGSSRPVTGGG